MGWISLGELDWANTSKQISPRTHRLWRILKQPILLARREVRTTCLDNASSNLSIWSARLVAFWKDVYAKHRSISRDQSNRYFKAWVRPAIKATKCQVFEREIFVAILWRMQLRIRGQNIQWFHAELAYEEEQDADAWGSDLRAWFRLLQQRQRAMGHVIWYERWYGRPFQTLAWNKW